MPKVIVGAPEEEPRMDENRPSFYIHKNLNAVLEPRTDGTVVIGIDPKSGKEIFETKPFPTTGQALGFIEAKKRFFGEHDDEGTKAL